MRDILFKAKRTDNGEWVEGGYFSDGGDAYIIKITRRKNEWKCEWQLDEFEYVDQISVDPATVCEYTGLKDRKGNNIFEGDIVYAQFVCKHSKQNFTVIFEDGSFAFDNGYVTCSAREICNIVICGNRFDNPEILKIYDN